MQCCSKRTVYTFRPWELHVSTTRGHPSIYHIDTKGESILCAKIGYIWPCPWSAKTVPHTIQTLRPGAPALTTGTNYGAERSIWGSHKSGSCPSAVRKEVQHSHTQNTFSFSINDTVLPPGDGKLYSCKALNVYWWFFLISLDLHKI